MRLRYIVAVAATAAISAGLQMVGAWRMQPFHHVRSAGDGPLQMYYAGFGLAVACMFAVIALSLRRRNLEITDDEIVLDRRRWSRRSTTLLVRRWRRPLLGEGALLEIHSGADVCRLGARKRLPSSHPGETAKLGASRLDALMGILDFDEVLSRLALPGAPPPVVGLRVNLVPFRRTALGALASMKPFFLTVLALGVLGPTLGPSVSRMRFGNVAMTPVVLFIVMSGIVGVMVSYERPAKLIRLVIDAQQARAMDMRSGATLALAPVAAISVQRFHFLLMGGRFEAISLRNRGLRMIFPGGFSISIALPAFAPWPDRVPRHRAPRWTLDPAAADRLLRVMTPAPGRQSTSG